MSRIAWNSPAAKTVAALIVVVLLAVWLLWPQGVPPPDEANRGWHPDGYSLIAPPGWEMSFERSGSNPGWLRFEPANYGYWPPFLRVSALRQAPDQAELRSRERFVDGTFRGSPALVSSAPSKKYWINRVIFQDQGRWFEIGLSTPEFEDGTRSDYWPYIESFRYDPSRAETPATTQSAPVKFITPLPSAPPNGG